MHCRQAFSLAEGSTTTRRSADSALDRKHRRYPSDYGRLGFPLAMDQTRRSHQPSVENRVPQLGQVGDSRLLYNSANVYDDPTGNLLPDAANFGI